MKTWRVARPACASRFIFWCLYMYVYAAAAQDSEAGGASSAGDPYRSAAAVGLGGNHYMSAYKKLLQQA